MGLENLLHFEGTQSERSCSKFMFWAGSGINPCQHQHDSMSVSPNAKQKKPGISQPLFPLLFDTAQHNQVSHHALQAEQKELFIICVINPFLISKLISTHVNYSKEIPITSVMCLGSSCLAVLCLHVGAQSRDCVEEEEFRRPAVVLIIRRSAS